MIKATIAIIDLAIIGILIFFIYRGWKNGFIKEFMRIFGTIVALVIAIRYMSDVAIAIYGVVDLSPVIITILTFIIIFTTVLFGVRFLAEKLMAAVKFSMSLGSLDRIAGVAFGLAKGAIFVSLITILLSFATFSGPLKEEIKQSMLFNPMRNVLPLAYSAAKLAFSGNYQPFYKELDESFSGQPQERRGRAQDLIDYYRTK